ncbi:MAG: rRNA maturation RNase YbeY [Halioglobus sp.]|nr:rRNA maturation RNase YbeY [Halioglobus sp.]
MILQVDVQNASAETVPAADEIRGWIAATLAEVGRQQDTEITVRLVDSAEMSQLNRAYRGKPGPTNVLSFAADLPPRFALPLLGDIVICAPLVHREAGEQCKSPAAHWAHMTIHGTLHLLGYDHTEEEQASTMEALESSILNHLEYPCPYTGASAQP